MNLIQSLTERAKRRKKTKSKIEQGSWDIKEQVLQALSNVMDPDLHQDIVSLGFIKNLEIKCTGNQPQHISFTIELTTAACPVKEQLKQQALDILETEFPEVKSIDIKLGARPYKNKGLSAAQLQASLGRVKNIIAVASGKGGVGKSTTAVNLAWALKGMGAQVGILDADVYGPSIPLMTGAGLPTAMNGNLVVPPQVDSIKTISVAMFSPDDNKAAILRGPMAGQIIKQFLEQIDWGELDYLIIDYPPGTGDIQLTLSQMCPLSGAVIVTTPQDVALIDVKKALQMFETMKVPIIGIVETMSYFEIDGQRHYIFGRAGGQRLAKEYGLPLLAEIPIEPAVCEGADKGKPIVTQDVQSSQARQAYWQCAKETARQLAILEEQLGGALDQFSLIWKREGETT